MQIDVLANQLLQSGDLPEASTAALDDMSAQELVDQLKREADRHYWINANRSLELAEMIVRLGQLRNNAQHTALGLMTRGDALKFLGQNAAAWQALGEAGALFESADNAVGWARTRIGRLLICVDLRRVDEALADAEQARAIFAQHAIHEKLLVLDLNTAIVHDLLGDQVHALAIYHRTISAAESLGEVGRPYLGLLYNSTGVAYEILGRMHEAQAYYERACATFTERAELSAAAFAKKNIALILVAKGQHRQALQILHELLRSDAIATLPLDMAHTKREIINCYLQLNRYREARELAIEVVEAYQRFGASYKQAVTLLHLATAEAELGDLQAAQIHLDTAEEIFTELGAESLIATTDLERGQIALQQGQIDTAQRAAVLAATIFEAGGQRVQYAQARLLYGRTLLAQCDLQTAMAAGADALAVARQSNAPPLRYTAHLLLGQVAEARGSSRRAERHYRAAVATATRVQQSLTITLRPGFLEDKGEALRVLIGLYLRDERVTSAFETIERAKSQTLLSYLTNREQLRWAAHDDQSRGLLDQLNHLRTEHQWFYRQANERSRSKEEGANAAGIDPQRAREELARCERKMRMLTEQLYLRSSSSSGYIVAFPSWRHVQEQIDPRDLLVEYYHDGAQMWAFALDSLGLAVFRLPASMQEVGQRIQQLQLNLSAALVAGSRPQLLATLGNTAQRLLQQLYDALLRPLSTLMQGRRRLLVVPYGTLHYLPFHLLHDRLAHLIEQCEVVVLPAASLLTRPSPRRTQSARVLGHSWEGRLPDALREAQLVADLTGAELYQEQHATRAALQHSPTQILHIAAHGRFRLDQPDLSYLQLDDGQLYSDDLLQQDLSYELVTLSGCETGRANVVAGDELIGLGRGFLYAGAGALITSLWRVPDEMTLHLMTQLYQRLLAGDSKATAMRTAQCAMLADGRWPHPALWGAFQLVGDPRPLTGTSPVDY